MSDPTNEEMVESATKMAVDLEAELSAREDTCKQLVEENGALRAAKEEAQRTLVLMEKQARTLGDASVQLMEQKTALTAQLKDAEQNLAEEVEARTLAIAELSKVSRECGALQAAKEALTARVEVLQDLVTRCERFIRCTPMDDEKAAYEKGRWGLLDELVKYRPFQALPPAPPAPSSHPRCKEPCSECNELYGPPPAPSPSVKGKGLHADTVGEMTVNMDGVRLCRACHEIPAQICGPCHQSMIGKEPSERDATEIIYPAQCDCGHIFLEKFKFKEPTEEGNIAFCWCGFCMKRTWIKAKSPSEPKREEK